MTRTRALPLALLATTLAALLTLSPAAQAQGGQHVQTVLKSHGLKEQVCLDADRTALFQGDGRSTRKYFANVVTTFLDASGTEVGRVSASIESGKKTPQGGVSAQGETLVVKMKVYTSQRTHLVARDKAKVAIATLPAC